MSIDTLSFTMAIVFIDLSLIGIFLDSPSFLACKTPQQMREMFLNAKNKIFAADGSIDISRMSKDLDEILTVKFGRNPMSSVVHPR